MKTKTLTLYFSMVIFLLLSCIVSSAQDWRKESKTIKMLTDTSLVRAYEVTIMPKEKGQVHAHPAYFAYALTECHLVVHYSDGKDEKVDINTGDSAFSSPERPHWTENVGDKPAKFLLVELKEHPYK